MFKQVVIALVVIACIGWRCGNCQLFATPPGAVLGDLPVPVAQNILAILIHGAVQLLGNCSNSNDVPNVQFWLYTRANSNNAIVLNDFNQINASKPIKFLIHGWGGNANIHYIAVIKDAYLQQYDCNVLSVDYSVYVAGTYTSAYCYVPAVGRAVAQFICNMSSTLNITLAKLHVVGHSLGAQVAGIMGNELKNTCGAISRITGLDPAGPLYDGFNSANRLDKSDATFVDVIHTNQGQYGYVGDCGTVDFFPNCGYFQPGCLNRVLSSLTSLADITNLLLSVINCNHQRSCYLFAESIYNDAFYASSCYSCVLPACAPDVLFATHAYMGESCKSAPPRTQYTLTTNDKPPYAKGPTSSVNTNTYSTLKQQLVNVLLSRSAM